MDGQRTKGSLLNQQYQNQLAQWDRESEMWGGIAAGAGQLLGAAFFSSKDAKTDKKPSKGNLEAVENMPVEEWTYRDGIADEGRHVGPYAEDFAKETGVGDGKSINVIDAIGVTMGAVKELSNKVDRIAAQRGVA